jgi:hypothetical protein
MPHIDDDHDYIGFAKVLAGTAVVGVAAFIGTRLHVAHASQMLTRTGPFIRNIQAARVFVRWPFMRVKPVSLEARTIPIKSHVRFLTSERYSVALPSSVVVCVNGDSPAAVALFAQQFDDYDSFAQVMDELATGAMRALVAETSIQHLSAERLAFQKALTDRLETLFTPYGLIVRSVAMDEVRPDDTNDVFTLAAKTAYSKLMAESTKVISENQRAAAVVAAERKMEERIRLAQVAIETAAKETERDQRLIEMAANVANTKIETKRITDTRSVEATQQVAMRRVELETNVSVAQQALTLETERSKQVAEATAAKEKLMIDADGQYASISRLAEAELVKQSAQSEAKLVDLTKVADGARRTLFSEAEGLDAIATALGDRQHVLPYLMLKSRMPVDIARAMSDAVKDMRPTIYSSDPGSVLAKLMQDLGAVIGSTQAAGVKLPAMFSMSAAEPTTPVIKK